MTSTRRLAAARRHGWLRAAYLHNYIVKDMLSAVAADSNIAAGVRASEVDRPDATLGASLSLDVVPNTEVSRQAHLGRCGIEHVDQLITYEPATEAKLRDVFDAEHAPNANG